MIECQHGYDHCPKCDAEKPPDPRTIAASRKRRARASEIAGRTIEDDAEAKQILRGAGIRLAEEHKTRKKLDTIVDRAAEAFGSISALAKASGVPLRTLMFIRSGRPGNAAIHVLLAILAENQGQARRLCQSAVESLNGRPGAKLYSEELTSIVCK